MTIFNYKEFEEANRGIGQVCRIAELFLVHMVNKATSIGDPSHTKLMTVRVIPSSDTSRHSG
jgi:hypothetical protein